MIDFFKEKDKQLHIAATFIIAFIVTMIANRLMLEPIYTYGFIGGMLVGVGKEVYDYYDYGLFDKRDIVADAIGSLIGAEICFALIVVVT